MKTLLILIAMLLANISEAQIHVFDRLVIVSEFSSIDTYRDTQSTQVHIEFGIFTREEMFDNKCSFLKASDLYITIIGQENQRSINLREFDIQISITDYMEGHTRGYVRWNHKTLPNNFIILKGWWDINDRFTMIDRFIMIDENNQVLKCDAPVFRYDKP